MVIPDELNGVGTVGRDGVVDAVIGHCWTKVLDEVIEVVGEPGVWGEDEGWSGLEKMLQGEMILVLVSWCILFFNGCHLWYTLIKLSACTFSDGSHVLLLCGYPFHLMRYCNRRRRPNMRWLRTASTLYSSSPSIRSGGGLMKFGP